MSTITTPRVYSIPPGVRFLPTLVDTFLAGDLVPGFVFDGDPLRLADATIYVPTRRAARELRAIFASRMGGSAILPVIRPLGGGVLTDHAVAGGGRHELAGGGLTRNVDAYQAMVQRARPFAFLSRRGQKLSEAAYRFILQHPGVTTVLGGFSELSHLEEAVGCSGAESLPDEDMAYLQMVWRSNCGRWTAKEQFISGL